MSESHFQVGDGGLPTPAGSGRPAADHAVAQFLVFTLAGAQYALPLPVVVRVVRAVAPTPVPGQPAICLGFLDVHGTIVPLLDVRRRFGHPPRPLHLDDRIVLATTRGRTVGLAVETVPGLIARRADEIVAAEVVLPGGGYIKGVAKAADGLILIHDLDAFLSSDEIAALEACRPGTGEA